MEVFIREGERLDDLGRDGLRLIQNPAFFCFGIDAVLLSSFVKAKSGDRILDFCSGNGILPVLLSSKTRAKEIVGMEIQQELYEMASRSIELNGLSPRVKMIRGDLRNSREILAGELFDVICANPPYVVENSGLKSENDHLRLARSEETCSFRDLMGAVKRHLKQKGHFFMIHRPLRLVEILSTMREFGIEPKCMRLVEPYEGKEPNLVLIEGIKGGASELRIAPNLRVYRSPGEYTQEVLCMYGLGEKAP